MQQLWKTEACYELPEIKWTKNVYHQYLIIVHWLFCFAVYSLSLVTPFCSFELSCTLFGNLVFGVSSNHCSYRWVLPSVIGQSMEVSSLSQKVIWWMNVMKNLERLQHREFIYATKILHHLPWNVDLKWFSYFDVLQLNLKKNGSQWCYISLFGMWGICLVKYWY